MHVALVAHDEALAAELAAAWRSGGSCTMTAAGIAVTVPPAHTGVFIPLASLGLAQEVLPPAERALADVCLGADLVVVHVTALDAATLHEGLAPRAVAVAGAAPVVVLAGESVVGRRDWLAGGIAGVYQVGSDPVQRRAAVARVARTWAPRWADRRTDLPAMQDIPGNDA
jgi:glycerate kinase